MRKSTIVAVMVIVGVAAVALGFVAGYLLASKGSVDADVTASTGHYNYPSCVKKCQSLYPTPTPKAAPSINIGEEKSPIPSPPRPPWSK